MSPFKTQWGNNLFAHWNPFSIYCIKVREIDLFFQFCLFPFQPDQCHHPISKGSLTKVASQFLAFFDRRGHLRRIWCPKSFPLTLSFCRLHLLLLTATRIHSGLLTWPSIPISSKGKKMFSSNLICIKFTANILKCNLLVR